VVIRTHGTQQTVDAERLSSTDAVHARTMGLPGLPIPAAQVQVPLQTAEVATVACACGSPNGQ